jgi:hypothetical protein
MRPITFSQRYTYSVINPDGVAKMKDLSTGAKFYAVWKIHPEVKSLTVLRKMFATHEGARSYATRFGRRYIRLLMATAAPREMVAAPKRPWWRRMLHG